MNEVAARSLAKKLPHSFFVFGRGSVSPFYTQDLSDFSDEELLRLKPEKGEVYYCGHRVFKTVIQPFLKKHGDYSLMPSRFLETFGMTALESLSLGVPVVGPAKGGLRSFVLGEYLLKGSLLSVLEWKKPSEAERKRCIQLAEDYSSEAWLKRVDTLLPKGAKRILMVSDFLNSTGGAEQQMQESARLLQEAGYELELFGRAEDLKPRVLGLLVALWNLPYAWRLRRKLRDFDPDVIWCHGVLRWLGPSSLRVLNQSGSKKLITHHDLGLFVPRPSCLKGEADLTGRLHWKDFASSPLALFKYFFLLKPIHRLLHGFLHLLPSEFMKEPLGKVLGGEVVVLPHFLR